jgi:hypothetical protein
VAALMKTDFHSRFLYKKNEICISGIATLTKHSLPTYQKKEERKREHVFISMSNSNKTPQTINEKEKPSCYRLGTVSGKTIFHRGFKPGTRVHQTHICPNSFSYEQTSAICK